MPRPRNRYPAVHHTWIPEHGYVLLISIERLKELEADLDAQSICSQAVPKIPAAIRGCWMLCFISTKKGYFTHVARSVAYYLAESGKDKLDLWNVMPFTKPVRMAAIKAKLHGRQAWRAKKAPLGGHISSSAFDLIIEAFRHADAEASKITEGLVNRRLPPLDPTPTPAKINWA